jgi:Ca2+-binding RTX toxin-like protein
MTNTTGSPLSQTITSGAGADTIYGGAGADTINAGSGADSINGGTGIDNMTGGEGADTINGGAGNDTITLTETTAAVDDVVISYSEAGTNVDTVIGFTTTSTGDEIQLSLAALEAAGTSGIHSAATNFQALNADTNAGVGAGTVQVMSAAAASANAANIFVLSGITFSSLSEVEDAIETGGSRAIGVSATDNDTAVADAFIVVWTDGANAYVSSVRIAVDSGTTGVLAAGGTVAANLVILTGVTSIGSSTFAAGNFEWIT